MIRNTKSMAALLACLLTASVFTACGASDTGTQPPVTEAPAVSADTTAEPSEPLIDWTSAGIDPVDYNGDDLHFIVQSITANTHAWFMMDPEETNGEVLNDAIFDRNAKIEELFNIKITSEYNDAPHTMIKKAVSAGDSAYDATLCYLGNLSTIGREGNLYNWYDQIGRAHV